MYHNCIRVDGQLPMRKEELRDFRIRIYVQTYLYNDGSEDMHTYTNLWDISLPHASSGCCGKEGFNDSRSCVDLRPLKHIECALYVCKLGQAALAMHKHSVRHPTKLNIYLYCYGHVRRPE